MDETGRRIVRMNALTSAVALSNAAGNESESELFSMAKRLYDRLMEEW